jgi:hypothetical protein
MEKQEGHPEEGEPVAAATEGEAAEDVNREGVSR